ncbi:hypothetical protein HY285_03945 [Candidatus Peregrinibacteria bacterium]|nr:hypothetical protein [Candidatus Peregrinibacteria bacterium]MBI3816667.1 hypothetical protein [Candidatus Peregrinibacteria bacterium]
MPSRVRHAITNLELEEKILNGGLLVAILGLFFPWLSGQWLGDESVTYTGFGFYTSFLGTAVFLLLLSTVLITGLPLCGGPSLVKKRRREIVRLCLTSQATVLTFAMLSVLTKITFEFSHMQVRFGISITIIGCLIALLYAFLRLQEQRRSQSHELFHHPENSHTPEKRESSLPPPPPPPPPAPEPENHRLYP